MNSWVSRARALLCLLATCLFTTHSEAILFEATSNTAFNTTAPTGALTNNGWQYEGQWNTEQGPFLGTPIAPTFFLAAQHIGGLPGTAFVFNGLTYTTVTNFDDPNTDLRIWQVAQTFPYYAPLYTETNEVGKLCVAIGRGYDRGNAVIVTGKTNGWQWGSTPGVQRWGENIISQIYNSPPLNGDHLLAVFDRNGITNECMLTTYDSSGGMFIEDGTTWKIAGIHHAVSDPFVSTNGVDGSGFNAALVDYGGLYIGGDGNWALITNQMADIPGYFISTRVSVRTSWINSVINLQPGPDMRITNIAPAGVDIHISLSTGSNRLYLVQKTSDLVTGSWTTVTNNLVGNGSIVTAIDPGATTQPKRFYRVQLLQ
jgi:hypothetical protein